IHYSTDRWGRRIVSSFDKWPHRTARLAQPQQAAELSSSPPATLGSSPGHAHAMKTPFAETSEQKARPGCGGGPGQERGSTSDPGPSRTSPYLFIGPKRARSDPGNCDSNLSQICALAARPV